ncbi:hypothetical protein HMPREF3193_00615 [Bifidobacterium breve]|nr:hypothetical protein HMPREF1587_00057 [Bifidobacterium breve JCP7499]KOA57155.1 hypothetical protein BBM0305_07610 [Bifidobacterium breve MCC 0305]KOA67858.1 hypothetical protein BBM1605_01375 [Bifidobacterium breve MCC 1605]KWZ86076.1 hypothetical protein HMPREF3193_00615 [Bifidobacterium breve]
MLLFLFVISFGDWVMVLGEVDVSVVCRGKYRICLLRIEQTFEECASFAIAYSSERVDIIWLLVLQEVVA